MQKNKRREACQIVPLETLINGEDIKTPIISPSPDYAAALENLHKKMQKADTRIHEIEDGHNTRYFVFLMLAFVAGGKLANASRSMVKHDSVRPSSWIFICLRFIGVKTLLILKSLIMWIIMPLLRLICLASESLARWYQGRANRRRKQKDLEAE